MNSDKKKRRPVSESVKNKRKRVVVIALSVAAAVLLLLGSAVAPLFMRSTYPETIIMVNENGNLSEMGETLSQHYDNSQSGKVILAAKLMGPLFKLRPGAYLIPAGSSPFQTARLLGRGGRHIVTVSLNNIRTPEQLAERVASQMNFSKEEFLAALNNDELARTYGLTRDNIMALFIADNYDFYWETSPENFIRKIGENYTRFWNEERRGKAARLGLSPAEISIIASIADEESNKGDEKGKICRLYYNRVKKGMKLQADPTVKYALGDFDIKRITGEMLKTASPYNTYHVAGLPPGPIRITDKRTVDAFLNSEATTDLYMCAREDFSGYHNFSASYDEHLANAKRYQDKLNQLDIR